MSDALRMDLADCGSPEQLIGAILKHHPNWTPPVPIEDLAVAAGIVEFRDLETDGFEGALMTDPAKTWGVILTKAGRPEGRRRFTVSHELGHFLLPSHTGNRQCTAADLREQRLDTTHQRQEAEANRFAAGLLMPRPWFARDMTRLGEADVTHLQILKDAYGTSLEAAANRYIELTDDTCAVVFSKDGVIRYVRPAGSFPRLAVGRGDRVPGNYASLKAPSPLRVATAWTELDGQVWLEDGRGRRPPPVHEQSMRQKDGFQVTLLFIDSVEAEDDEEGQDLEESYAVHFKR